MKYIYTDATYSGYYAYLVENNGDRYTQVTVNRNTYYIPTSRVNSNTNLNSNQLLIRTDGNGRKYYIQKSDAKPVII